MSVRGREVRLAARPQGEPVDSDFEVAEVELGDPPDGKLLIRNAYVSVDPYMRARMNDVPSYVPPYRLGEPMLGEAVGKVVAGSGGGVGEGDWVVHGRGWREWAVADPRAVLRIDPSLAPLPAYLGVLGSPGLTAYVGVHDIGEVGEGDVVFVSAAAGAVGSAAGQMAKLRGATVVGSAGSPDKVAWLRELGFDGAFSYRETRTKDALRELAPEGIDVYFDNVGGETLEAAIFALRDHGRVVACGSISRYNDTRLEPGPRNLFLVVTKRLRIQGFIVLDHFDRAPAFAAEAAGWIRDGRLRWRETVVEGIENAPAAFLGLLRGENVGKMLVRVGPDT